MDDVVLSNLSITKHIEQPNIKLEWSNLSVNINTPPSCIDKLRRKPAAHENNMVLKNVTGFAEPRSLLAIMGSSGAGKSTLLNVLSRQNISHLGIQGSILVNGIDISRKIRKISGYVQQEDLFIGTITVKEHLTFQAFLRMGDQYTEDEKKNRVNEVLEELGLMKCKDTVIGIPGRIPGISGGEKKRLSFASEIITNPPLLFVDEPTSGLDSFMAESVIMALQRIANEGKTVLATIHQPSSKVFDLFDRLLLIAEGRTAYIGTKAGAMDFFKDVGYPCPINYNPADHYIYTLATISGKEEECKKKTKGICDKFMETYKEESTRSEGKVDECDIVDARKRYKPGITLQMSILLWRAWHAANREPYIGRARITQGIFTALILGLAYLQQPGTSKGTMNLNAAIFVVIVGASSSSMFGCLRVFPAELPVFKKEHKQGLYRSSVYFLSKILAELPWDILQTVLLGSITYWMIGFRPDADRFFIYLGVLQITVQCALSFGYFISTLAPTVQVALAMGPPLMMPLMLFGGFFIQDGSIPVYFIWIKYLSWYKYANENLQINQWDGFGSIDCGSIKSGCLSTGKAVLELNGNNPDNFYRNLVLMFLLIFGFRLLSFLMLLKRVTRTK